MPLYEYCCENCGEEFEKLVRFSEEIEGFVAGYGENPGREFERVA